MSAPPGRRSPGVGGPGLSESFVSADGAGQLYSPPPTARSDWPRRWARVVERRHAQRELDQLLDFDRYPDIVKAYGATAALLRILAAEVVS
jgi:hypothetical protein